ncbi:MAG: hypothetical protein KJ070_16660 [Verrucomicrobia bacterium]|nr:hypothetical protein [Verrucomicrobiota bacterium]
MPTQAIKVHVAQVSNLLYRRLPVGKPPSANAPLAGWKPAIQQTGSLRYDASTLRFSA